jgi:MoaA/NifB/PqqE/SkfB family radical SAM enzyme
MNPFALELLDKVKAQNRRLNKAERELKRTVLDSLPPSIQIEPTNRCDHHCLTCGRSYYDKAKNPPGDFPIELFEQLDVLFAFAESVVFGGYGEPLMGENFKELLGLASQYNCRTELITNGALLDGEMAEFLCGMGVERVLFSVDAASDVEMVRMRGISLSEVLGAIEALREIGGLNAPRVAFNVTLSINNLDHLAPLVSLAASHGVSEVIVSHQKIYSKAQAQDSVFHHAAYARQVFEEAAEQARIQRITLELPPLEGQAPCHQPLELLMIGHDGRVQGCCSAMFEGGWPKLELGALGTDDLSALWNHPLMQQARAAAFGIGEWPAPCAACAFRVFNAESHLRLLDEEQGP